MTWTYTSTDISLSRDKVRLTIGDTDSGDQILQDEEIAYALTLSSDVRSASVYAAEFAAAKYTRLADKSMGDLSISYSQKADSYLELAGRLRRSVATGALPYFGGISISGKDSREADTDRVKPAFTVDMLDDTQIADSDEDDA